MRTLLHTFNSCPVNKVGEEGQEEEEGGGHQWRVCNRTPALSVSSLSSAAPSQSVSLQLAGGLAVVFFCGGGDGGTGRTHSGTCSTFGPVGDSREVSADLGWVAGACVCV